MGTLFEGLFSLYKKASRGLCGFGKIFIYPLNLREEIKIACVRNEEG